MSSPQSGPPRPRLCHVSKWAHFDGYGFNLHAEKARPGQFVGKVDEGSPAEAAGLRRGDRIVEVNGVNISHENHKQVVQRIRASPSETRLLVVDAAAEDFFRQRDVVITGQMREVDFRSSEDRRPRGGGGGGHRLRDEDRNSVESANSDASSANGQHNAASAANGKIAVGAALGSSTWGSSPRSTPSPDPDGAGLRGHLLDGEDDASLRADWDGLNLGLSAAEMRSKIGSRKKRDPRKDERMDFRRKYEIIDGL